MEIWVRIGVEARLGATLRLAWVGAKYQVKGYGFMESVNAINQGSQETNRYNCNQETFEVPVVKV